MIVAPVFRLRVITAITELIATISPDDGYQMDLRPDNENAIKSVVRGRTTVSSDDPNYMVTILEPPTAVDALVSKAHDNVKRAGEWDILIQGWAKDDPRYEPCDLAYVLAADVQKALAAQKIKNRNGRPGTTNFFGYKEITGMDIGTPVVRPTQELSGHGTFYFILTLKLVEDISNPLG